MGRERKRKTLNERESEARAFDSALKGRWVYHEKRERRRVKAKVKLFGF